MAAIYFLVVLGFPLLKTVPATIVGALYPQLVTLTIENDAAAHLAEQSEPCRSTQNFGGHRRIDAVIVGDEVPTKRGITDDAFSIDNNIRLGNLEDESIQMFVCDQLFAIPGSRILESSELAVEPEWKIYYNLTTNQTIDIIDSNNPRVSYYKYHMQRYLRIGFGPIPCSCQDLTCGCCSGINIQYYNFNQKACMNFTYDPYEFSLSLNMLMDDKSLFMQSISGKNPPPACIPFSVPLSPQINFCLKFFNIHTPGYNIFMCIDFETRIQSIPILILHFDCMQMGADGIQYHKPEDAEILPVESSNENNQEGAEIYDEVFEEDENKTSTAKPRLQTSTQARRIDAEIGEKDTGGIY